MVTLHSLKNEIEYQPYGAGLLFRGIEVRGNIITGNINVLPNNLTLGQFRVGDTAIMNINGNDTRVRVTRTGITDIGTITVDWIAV